MFGHVGCHVPQVTPDAFMALYRVLAAAIAHGQVASCHGIYRGGLGVHLAMTAMAGGLGLSVDLAELPAEESGRNDGLLYSESAGRFIVTIDPARQATFEAGLGDLPWACVGRVTAEPRLKISGVGGNVIIDLTLPALKHAWQKPLGDLI
jgi:phosphoribosylformylglycinamidine synthase